MHQIAAEDAQDYSTEIHFDEGGRSVAGRILSDMSPDHPWQKRVQEDVAHGRLSALATAPHKLWSSLRAPVGRNQLGGRLPEGFALPEAEDFASGYGYVGTLTGRDPAFDWLGRDIHLIWPFFCDFHPPLFLDISDPLQPQLIRRSRCAMLDASTGDVLPLDEDMVPEEADEIADVFADEPARPRFEPYRFDMVPHRGAGFGEADGVHAGAPVWVQYPEVPLDPETGEVMRYLCQVSARPALLSTSARPDPGSVYHPAFERMDFWGAGVLFAFISDSSKTLCLLVQNS